MLCYIFCILIASQLSLAAPSGDEEIPLAASPVPETSSEEPKSDHTSNFTQQANEVQTLVKDFAEEIKKTPPEDLGNKASEFSEKVEDSIEKLKNIEHETPEEHAEHQATLNSILEEVAALKKSIAEKTSKSESFIEHISGHVKTIGDKIKDAREKLQDKLKGFFN